VLGFLFLSDPFVQQTLAVLGLRRQGLLASRELDHLTEEPDRFCEILIALRQNLRTLEKFAWIWIGAEESGSAEPEHTSPRDRGCSQLEHLIRIYQTLASPRC
jgi:hypothetical protein